MRLLSLRESMVAGLLGDWLLRHDPVVLRKFRCLALTAAVSATAAAGFNLGTAKPALAEFEIQEADIEKGEVEIQYFGAVHWGLPNTGGATGNAEDEEAPLRQSHELQFQMGVTDWWMLSLTGGFDQPDDDDLRATSVEVETQFQLIKRKGDGIALAVQGGYAQAVNQLDTEQAHEISFGPIVELAKGPVVLTLNPLFNRQQGEFSNQEGLGFEYGWQVKYEFSEKTALALEMFGNIEDLANPGSFNDQEHSIGPVLYLNFGDTDSDDNEKAGVNDDDHDKKKGAEFTVGVGALFGVTDATSDVALKVMGDLQF
jgi:hypothetical protein